MIKNNQDIKAVPANCNKCLRNGYVFIKDGVDANEEFTNKCECREQTRRELFQNILSEILFFLVLFCMGYGFVSMVLDLISLGNK